MVIPTYETTAKGQEMIINELRSINRTQENRINIQKEEIEDLQNQLQQKENIIKEVREYIENNDLYEQDYDYDYEENLVVGPPSDETVKKILLEILDKENK